MSALPVLSVEVWQMILRFSISTSGFLDPDTFEGDLKAPGFGDADHSRDDEATYWESERTRNTLQRVCKPWDAYLRGFEHRYVRMVDIRHHRIDEKFIKKAIRISLYLSHCACREVCHRSSPPGGRPGLMSVMEAHKTFSQFCCKTILGLHDLPAEIIDADAVLGGFLWNAGALQSLKEVKAVIAWRFYGDTIVSPLFSQTPSLKHLRGEVHDDLRHLQFTSRTLVTLSLRVEREESYRVLVLDLPALRHLRIDFGSRMKLSLFFENILVPFFRKVGDHLRSIYIGSLWDCEYQMPVEIWERCPHLEIFHPGLKIKVSAPMSHPVHTLSVLPEYMPQTLKLQWPNLRRLILDGKWSKVDREGLSELFPLWRSELQGRGVTFEDSEGIALESVMETRGLI